MAMFIAVAAMLLTMSWLVLGLRGRRVNDHPVCRRCRFDLGGVYPAVTKCPECGAGLEGKRAVRTGVRRKRRGALALAGVCGVVMIGAGVLAGSQLASGLNLNQHKPVWLLLWEGGGSRDSVANAALDELVDRQANGRLGSGEELRVIERALAYQGDASKAWRTGWGMLVEHAWLRGALSGPERVRYVDQGLKLAFEARPRVRAMDPLPVELVLEHRFGDTGFLEVYLRHCGTMAAGSLVGGLDDHVIVRSRDFEPVAPAGRSVTLRRANRRCFVGVPAWTEEVAERSSGMPVVSRWVLEVVDVSGDRLGRRDHYHTQRFSTPPLHEKAPYRWNDDPDWSGGEVDGTEFDARAWSVSMLANRAHDLGAVPIVAHRMEFARGVEVVPPSESCVALRDDAMEVDAARLALAGGGHVLPGVDTRFYPPSMDGLTVPMAFDVFARLDGVEHLFDTLIYEPPGPHSVGWSSYRREGVHASQSGYIEALWPLRKVEVVLRPSADLARETVWIDRMIGREIVLQVDIQGIRMRGKPVPRRR